MQGKYPVIDTWHNKKAAEEANAKYNEMFYKYRARKPLPMKSVVG